MKLVQRWVQAIGKKPRVLDMARWMLEMGYHGHHRVIRQESLSACNRVLDLGCGTGTFAGMFDPARYTGVDIVPEYVAAARAAHPGHTFEIMNAQQLAFPSQTFDACFIAGVIHHLDDAAATAVLREVARVTRPDSPVVIWEDIPTRAWWNCIGRVVHRFDQGAYIRTPAQYCAIVGGVLSIVASYHMQSGFMDYAVFRCRSAAT